MKLWHYGSLCAALLLSLPPSASSPARYYRYPGVIHVHTAYSDGSGSFQEVASAANAAGLDYLIATDHNTLQPLKDGHQRYWDRTLVLVGTEISTDSGHCLALDVPASFEWGTREAGQVIRRVSAAGGFTILAHPLSPRWRWQDWSVRGFTGMEIVNLSSLVDDDLRAASHNLRIQDRSVVRLLELAKGYLANPDAVMRSLTDNTVDAERQQWDRLLGQGLQVVGTGAVDAHARVDLRGQVLKVPTYQEAFESVHTYAVTLQPLRREVEHDRNQIYSAYRNGRVYIVYPRVAPAPGFSFTAREADRQATMGQPIRLDRELSLTIEAPDHSHPLIRLLRNGEEVATAEERRLEWTVRRPGAYRVEVYAADRSEQLLSPRRGLRLPRLTDILRSRRRELRPWIFSNPIYVR